MRALGDDCRMIHLGGEQMLPNLLLARCYGIRRNVALVSDLTRKAGERFARAVGREAAGTELVEVADPHDPASLEEALDAVLERGSADGRPCCVNITGGTKVMSIAAVGRASRAEVPCVYLDTPRKKALWHDRGAWTADDLSAARPPLDLEDFFILGGYQAQNGGRWEDNPHRGRRLAVTGHLWRRRRLLASLYPEFARTDLGKDPCQSFGKPEKALAAVIEAPEGAPRPPVRRVTAKGRSIEVTQRLVVEGTEHPEAAEWPDFWDYLSGVWLEERVYQMLVPLVHKEKRITDLRLGMRLLPDPDQSGRPETLNEIDVLLTDGWRLWVVECKAGRYTQDHVYKLSYLADRLGGSQSTGCLLVTGDPNPAMKQAMRRLSFEGGRNNVFLVWFKPDPRPADTTGIESATVSRGDEGRLLRATVLAAKRGQVHLIAPLPPPVPPPGAGGHGQHKNGKKRQKTDNPSERTSLGDNKQ